MNEIDKQQEEKITDYMVRKQEKLVEEINKLKHLVRYLEGVVQDAISRPMGVEPKSWSDYKEIKMHKHDENLMH